MLIYQSPSHTLTSPATTAAVAPAVRRHGNTIDLRRRRHHHKSTADAATHVWHSVVPFQRRHASTGRHVPTLNSSSSPNARTRRAARPETRQAACLRRRSSWSRGQKAHAARDTTTRPPRPQLGELRQVYAFGTGKHRARRRARAPTALASSAETFIGSSFRAASMAAAWQTPRTADASPRHEPTPSRHVEGAGEPAVAPS